ncbi:hypothetical protein WMF38_57150 [Sorangium sp. So ce118]
MGNSKRFSKATVLEFIESRADHLQKKHDFNPRHGTSQVRGKGEDAAVAYGEFRALLDLAERIDGGDWL